MLGTGRGRVTHYAPGRNLEEEVQRMTREEEFTAVMRLMSFDQRHKVISRYAQTLEKTRSPVGRETDLPYSKVLIRKAIYEELCENPDSEQRNYLEIAFAQLECFLPPDEFKVVQDFKSTSSRAQDLARSGRAKDIVASAGILKQAEGEKAVGILERMSKKIRRRIREIRALKRPHCDFRGY